MIGGLGDDRFPDVLAAANNRVYVIGYTESSNLQTSAGAYDTSYGGSGDLYAVEFSLDQFLCGDANADGTVNISDAVYLISYIFIGGPAPDPLLAGDANCDGTVNISDAVYLISYIFSGGPAPCAGCK